MRAAFVFALFSAIPGLALAQTGASGAIAGIVRDQTGALVPSAQVTVRNQATNETRQTVTQTNGSFAVPLLPPGRFTIEVEMSGFARHIRTDITVTVTETTNLTVDLQLEGVTDTVQVSATSEIVQATSNTLGRVIDSRAVEGLPLVTRNYTQIIGLSPGITADVTDAGALGRGTGGTSPPNAHGNRSYDNNFQMNGLGVNDIFSQGTTSGGVPIPNPDTITEFKVQTGQYDAAYGRNAGANVNLVTKSGSNQLRGSAFEFFRDRSLNANSFFSNRNGQPKPTLDQNQFGITLGGPVVRDRFLFFGSYQGTRQTNGVSSLVTVLAPPLTDDRSAAAIGRLFAGQRGPSADGDGRRRARDPRRRIEHQSRRLAPAANAPRRRELSDPYATAHQRRRRRSRFRGRPRSRHHPPSTRTSTWPTSTTSRAAAADSRADSSRPSATRSRRFPLATCRASR